MRAVQWLVRGVVMLALAAGTAAVASAQQGIDPRLISYADMVIYNGKVLTADDNFTIVEAFAVRDGKVLARGKSADILRLAGPNTKKIDVQGHSVVPGFIESHSHGWEGQALKQDIDGTIVFKTLADGLEQVRKLVDKKGPGKLVQLFAPRNVIANNVTRWDLDKVSPKNPVLISFSTYEYNVNTLALKMFTDYVKDPDYPGLVKDPQKKEPNGQLRGLSAGVMGYEVLPWPDLTALRPKEVRRLKRYNREGTTMLIGRAPAASITMLRDIWAAGELPIRLRITHEFLRDNPEPEKFLKRMGNLTGLGDDWMKIIGTLVQQPDGGSAAGAILTSLPKLRLAPKDEYGPYGQDRWKEYSNGRETVELAAKYGWKLGSIHSYGDESTKHLLEAFRAGTKQTRVLDDGKTLPGGQWVVDHNYVATKDTIGMMQQLSVIPSVLQWWRLGAKASEESSADAEDQGGFTPDMGNAMVYMYGGDRLNDNWSMARTFIDAGLKPAAETAGTPLGNIQAFITRKDKDGRVWAPQERVSRREALWMKTRWVTFISQDQDKTGSLEEGKLADFAILGGDYMTVPEEQIGKLPVLMTVVGGKVVYEAEEAPGAK